MFFYYNFSTERNDPPNPRLLVIHPSPQISPTSLRFRKLIRFMDKIRQEAALLIAGAVFRLRLCDFQNLGFRIK